MSIRFDPEDDYPVVVIANRDELYTRPSAPPSVICETPTVFAPIDLDAGGTWIGVNEWGLVAAITNVWLKPFRRGDRLAVPSARSRGLLTLDALCCENVGAARVLVRQKILEETYQFFNLLVATAAEAVVFTHTGKLTEHVLTPGFATILNVPFSPSKMPSNNMPPFPANNRGKADWLRRVRELLSQHPDVCKHSSEFGTRSSQVIVLSRQSQEPTEDVFSHRFWYADGPPCQTDFRDFSSQLRAAMQPFSPFATP